MNILSTVEGILFRSDRNFMKRDAISNSILMNGPNESRYYGSAYIRRVTINHNLGYAPFFRVFFEPYLDGKVFPALSDSDWALANPINNSGGDNAAPVIMAEADEMTLVLTLVYPDSSKAGNQYPVHYIIYRDYGLGAA